MTGTGRLNAVTEEIPRHPAPPPYAPVHEAVRYREGRPRYRPRRDWAAACRTAREIFWLGVAVNCFAITAAVAFAFWYLALRRLG